MREVIGTINVVLFLLFFEENARVDSGKIMELVKVYKFQPFWYDYGYSVSCFGKELL